MRVLGTAHSCCKQAGQQRSGQRHAQQPRPRRGRCLRCNNVVVLTNITQAHTAHAPASCGEVSSPGRLASACPRQGTPQLAPDKLASGGGPGALVRTTTTRAGLVARAPTAETAFPSASVSASASPFTAAGLSASVPLIPAGRTGAVGKLLAAERVRLSGCSARKPPRNTRECSTALNNKQRSRWRIPAMGSVGCGVPGVPGLAGPSSFAQPAAAGRMTTFARFLTVPASASATASTVPSTAASSATGRVASVQTALRYKMVQASHKDAHTGTHKHTTHQGLLEDHPHLADAQARPRCGAHHRLGPAAVAAQLLKKVPAQWSRQKPDWLGGHMKRPRQGLRPRLHQHLRPHLLQRLLHHDVHPRLQHRLHATLATMPHEPLPLGINVPSLPARVAARRSSVRGRAALSTRAVSSSSPAKNTNPIRQLSTASGQKKRPSADHTPQSSAAWSSVVVAAFSNAGGAGRKTDAAGTAATTAGKRASLDTATGLNTAGAHVTHEWRVSQRCQCNHRATS